MKKGEERNLSVKFPDDYRDKTKAGKSAVFHVLLKSIQKLVVSEMNDDFAKKVGYQDMGEYRVKVKENLLAEKIRKNKDDLKKAIIKEFLNKSKFSSVPIEMVEHETEREWFSFLRRMGEEEKDYLKKNPDAKEFFISSHIDSSESLIKTTMILKAAIKKYGIEVTKEEVTTYTLNISTALQYDEDKKLKIMKDLDDPQIYKIQERAALNEKVIAFLVSKFE
jgi:trigger factor